MIRRNLLSALCLFCATALAQEAARPAFEVVSVKPASAGRNGRPINDAGQVEYRDSVSWLIMRAYGVDSWQISGPEWLATDRYDIVAKLPQGTAKKMIPLMLQSLLADRWHLAFHRDTKDFPVFAIVAARGGPKLHKVEAPPEAPARWSPLLYRDGLVHLAGTGSMRDFAHELDFAAEMDGELKERYFIDATGLEGVFDIKLNWSPGLASADGSEPGSASSIFKAIQEQLGFKIERRKASIEMFVIDHADRAPVGN